MPQAPSSSDRFTTNASLLPISSPDALMLVILPDEFEIVWISVEVQFSKHNIDALAIPKSDSLNVRRETLYMVTFSLPISNDIPTNALSPPSKSVAGFCCWSQVVITIPTVPPSAIAVGKNMIENVTHSNIKTIEKVISFFSYLLLFDELKFNPIFP